MVLSPRFRDGRFRNEAATPMMREPMGAGMAWSFVAEGHKRRPAQELPLFASTKAALQAAPSTSLRVTWLGHSTVLLEIDGVRLLTDPVWGERASPFAFAGPKRFHRPPLGLSELPDVDAVLLSHDHYDHLCADTVRRLARGASRGFSGRFVTALGVGARLEELGVLPSNIVELDWGEGTRVAGRGGAVVDVVSAPARHFSGRGVLDRDTTLWTSFVVQGERHNVFFSGDTGPTPAHKDIGASLGPFDVALFEIGAWDKSWADIHLGPAAAFDAFVDVNARAFLPVHWATFDLGLHAWEQPGEELFTRAGREGAPLWTPRLGEPQEAHAPTTSPWWRDVLARR